MLATATKRTAVSGVALGRSCSFNLIFSLIDRLIDCCVLVSMCFVSEMVALSRQSA